MINTTNNWLNNKHVLITGGSDGIGSRIAKKLKGNCKKLTIVARTPAKLIKIKKELSLNNKTEVETHSIDICDIKSMTNLINKIYQKDQIDAFVNCAGGTHRYDEFEKLNHEDIHKIVYTNGIAPMHWLRELLPRMKLQHLKNNESKRAQILLLSSRAAERPRPKLGAYAAGKHAIEGLIYSLRQEYARYGIVFTLINPGSVNTNLTSQWNEEDSKKHQDQAMSCKESVYPIIQALNSQFAINRISFESVQQWKTELGVMLEN